MGRFLGGVFGVVFGVVVVFVLVMVIGGEREGWEWRLEFASGVGLGLGFVDGAAWTGMWVVAWGRESRRGGVPDQEARLVLLGLGLVGGPAGLVVAGLEIIGI